jgi:hypothetical protein
MKEKEWRAALDNWLHISLLEDRPGENALDRLARRVLRSTLEQVRTQ